MDEVGVFGRVQSDHAIFFGNDPSAKALIWVAFGLFLIFTVYVVPNGLAGLVRRFIMMFARRPGD